MLIYLTCLPLSGPLQATLLLSLYNEKLITPLEDCSCKFSYLIVNYPYLSEIPSK